MRRAENNKHSRYSIRKLSVGVTSIAIASLFLGKVAYAVDSMQPISSTQGNRANTSKKWYDINEYGLIPVDISFEAAKKDFKEEVEKSLLSEEQQKTYNQKIEAARNKDDLLLTYHSEYSKDIKKHSTSTEPVEASVQETQASVSDSMVTDDSTSVTADSPEKTPSTETPAPSIPEVPEAPASSPESEESSVASSEETSSPETPVAPEAPALSEAPAQPAESEESSVAAPSEETPSPETPAAPETPEEPAAPSPSPESEEPSVAASSEETPSPETPAAPETPEEPAASSLVSEQTVQQPTSKRSSDKKEEQEQSYSPNRSLSRQVRAHESGKYLPSTGEKAQPLFIATMTLMSLFGSLLVTKRQKETKK
ncbi:TPA: LPXTG-anchored fibronectin-binding protein FbpA [Streptococcus pyogenes]|nr:LPXTG-anchored fibronectin-binding protein FbpA [Streptococcus pyogenes]